MRLSLENLNSLREKVLALGFDRVGFAPARPLDDFPRFESWLDNGYAAGMDYLPRHRQLRASPCELLAEAQSVIMVSMNYHWPMTEESDPGRGRVSRYARGRDYHKVVRKRLHKLGDLLKSDFGATATRACVDSAPLLERSLAAASGLGWIGKNTMLIDEKLGSWTFLGALLCDLDLPPDSPVADRCGTCTACLDACPTDAFPEPGVLDARRCISYLTIEHRDEIDPDLAAHMGDHIFGCDICQEVCPWNREVPTSLIEDYRPRAETTAPLLSELLKLDAPAFLKRFAGTPIMRAGLDGLLRNARLAKTTPGVGLNTEEVLIRALQDNDSITELTTLLNRAYASLARMGFRYVATWQDEEITQRRVGRGECLVAVISNRIVGTLLLEDPLHASGAEYYERSGVAKFQQFGVEPEWQGRGLGQRILRHAENRARAMGARELAFDTAEGAVHLIDMYKNWGYKVVGETNWDVTNYRSVIMSKELKST